MTKGKESKPHIGIFGRRNFGKSSFINALTGQDLAIVSEQAGTTTDPVKKSIEIPGLGACVLIDTAGIDDTGKLGKLRIKKSLQVIRQIDMAMLLITDNSWGSFEESLIKGFQEFAIPFEVIYNKSDLSRASKQLEKELFDKYQKSITHFSSIHPENKESLISLMKEQIPETAYTKKTLIGDLLSYGDVVMLITPIDVEAPEGRLILPQVQAIRDVLDHDSVSIILKEKEVDAFLKKSGLKPDLVITDSSIFLKADAMIPKDIPLTGFSIVLARHKGDFQNYLKGTPKISELQDGDKVLILESCTHHVSCDDIGRVKMPRWISNFTGKKLHFEVVAGLSALPEDINEYALVIQCGGCVITRKQVHSRLKPAIDAGVPVTNYGMAIAYVQGVYNRAIAPFVKSTSSNTDYL